MRIHRYSSRGFAISEIILVVTTATLAISTAFTALSVLTSMHGTQKQVVNARGDAASVLPADHISMEVTLFHLEFQKLIHEATMTYVIGGNRWKPNSEAAANFSFHPSWDQSHFHLLSALDRPEHAWSSYRVTQSIQEAYPSAFDSPTPQSPYDFTVLTVLENREVSAITTHRLTDEGDWHFSTASIFLPAGSGWEEHLSYRCALRTSDFQKHQSRLHLGATHAWLRHDDDHQLWARSEEGICQVSFPDHHWHLSLHPESKTVTSKFTYFLSVVK